MLNRSFTVSICACLLFGARLLAHDPHDPMVAIAISPNYALDHTVLVATGELTLKLNPIVLLKSVDGGVNWTVSSGLPSNSAITAVIYSPAYGQDQTVYFASGNGLFVSKDGATTWTTLRSDSIVGLGLSPSFATDNTLFVVNAKGKIFRSVNRGTSFTGVPAPSPLSSNLGLIALSPNFPSDHTLLMGSSASGIYRSTNGGGSWTAVTTGLTLPQVTALTFSPSFSSDQTVFAGTLGGGFLASTTAGASWALSNAGLTDLNVSSIALSPTYPQDSTLWVATARAGVFQSTTRGARWGRPVSVPRHLSAGSSIHYQYIAAAPGIQFLGMWEGLWASTNGGSSWQYVDTCPTRAIRYINMSPNYPRDQTVFVSTYGSGNLWSTDGGSDWTLQNSGMHSPYVDGSAISPNFANDGTAFGGVFTGLSEPGSRRHLADDARRRLCILSEGPGRLAELRPGSNGLYWHQFRKRPRPQLGRSRHQGLCRPLRFDECGAELDTRQPVRNRSGFHCHVAGLGYQPHGFCGDPARCCLDHHR